MRSFDLIDRLSLSLIFIFFTKFLISFIMHLKTHVLFISETKHRGLTGLVIINIYRRFNLLFLLHGLESLGWLIWFNLT